MTIPVPTPFDTLRHVWKQSVSHAWRIHMLALWHWGLVDKGDLSAIFEAVSLDPPDDSEFTPHHCECQALILELTLKLAGWDPKDSPKLDEPENWTPAAHGSDGKN